MQKIAMVLILLCIIFTTVSAQGTQHQKEKDTRILQLTKDAKLTDLTKSPNGKWKEIPSTGSVIEKILYEWLHTSFSLTSHLQKQ